MLSLRATESAKALARVPGCGFAPYVDGISNIKEDLEDPARKTVDALCALLGRSFAYKGDIPFKSLSLSLGDHAHAFELFCNLYIPGGPRNFMQMGRVRDALNREQMETVAAAYTAARECDF